MIFTTITMNPCLDRREYLSDFQVGKTNRPYKTTETAGGKGINVSRELVSMLDPIKASVHTVTFAGGATGERLKKLMEEELSVSVDSALGIVRSELLSDHYRDRGTHRHHNDAEEVPRGR